MTSADARHGFELVSDYITDPARDSVLVQTILQALPGHHPDLDQLQVYVRYDATIDNTGGGGSTNQGANDATVDPATTALVSSDHTTPSGPFAARVVGALVANRPFLAESSGFVGAGSDGLTQLDASHRLTQQYRSATDGNVVQTAQVDARPDQPFTLALGFGATAGDAVATATRSAHQSFTGTETRLRRPVEPVRRRPARAAVVPAGQRWTERRRSARLLLPVGQRHQARGGQDGHRRVRGLADRSLGAGGAGHHHPSGLDLPRGVRA